MSSERNILLVVHTGRDEATEVARRVQKVLGDNGIRVRVLSAEAVDRGQVQLSPDDMRGLGAEIEVVDADDRPPKAASWFWCSVATGASCARPSWLATLKFQCWA